MFTDFKSVEICETRVLFFGNPIKGIDRPNEVYARVRSETTHDKSRCIRTRDTDLLIFTNLKFVVIRVSPCRFLL